MSGPARPGGEVIPLRSPRKCPICGKPAERATRPFCSKRCADIDLHRWLAGAYAIPAADDPDEEDPGNPESV